MTLTAACGWALLRSVAIAVLALPVCHGLAEFLAGRRRAARTLAWGLLLVPVLTPELITGYGYANFALSLVHHPNWKEVLYAVLVGMKVVPVGTAAVYFAPPSPVSREALYCRRLSFLPSEGRLRRLRHSAGLWIRGPLRRLVPALLLMFLLAFQDFEIASLMWISSAWTVWLFDAQVGGMSLSESLRRVVLPLACEAAVLIPGLFLLLKSRSLPAAPNAPRQRSTMTAQIAAWSYLLAAAGTVCLVPFTLSARGVTDGLVLLRSNRLLAEGTLREIGQSGAVAVLAGLGAFALAAVLLRSAGRAGGVSPPVRTGPGTEETGGLRPPLAGALARTRLVATIVLSIWGLCGSLIVSLSILALFQQPGLHVLYDTPVPLLTALILYLLPRVLLLEVLLRSVRPHAAVHLASLLRDSPSFPQRVEGGELLWRLRHRGSFWLAILACYWAYLDLTAASLLAPVGVVTAPVRLYNLMHYTRSDALSALTVVTMAAPVLAVLLAAAIRRPFLRLCVR